MCHVSIMHYICIFQPSHDLNVVPDLPDPGPLNSTWSFLELRGNTASESCAANEPPMRLGGFQKFRPYYGP